MAHAQFDLVASWKAPTMLVSVSVSAGFHTILSWAIMVMEESWSLVDLYTGIRDGSVEVPSTSSCPFVFPETFREQPFSVSVGSKHCGPFHACSVSATLGGSGSVRELHQVCH